MFFCVSVVISEKENFDDLIVGFHLGSSRFAPQTLPRSTTLTKVFSSSLTRQASTNLFSITSSLLVLFVWSSKNDAAPCSG